MPKLIFRNRHHAGKLLAEALLKYAQRDDVIVLGLPRGGVPVAYEVARKLEVPLDVLVVRKLGVPGCEELAMGAIASGGVRVLNDAVVQAMGISAIDIEETAATELDELHRREFAYHGYIGTRDIRDKTVILVDDGIATGSTVRAAVQALQQREPKAVIIAVPVASSEARSMLMPMVDEFVALSIPAEFRAVGQWYSEFYQTTDAEVTYLLAQAAEHQQQEKGTS